MRCKKHISDESSGFGVCASCLRERLFALVAAQARAHSALSAADNPRKSDPNLPVAPPLHFPRSVSPYISRRKSDLSPWNNPRHHYSDHGHRKGFSSDRRFFSTPQVGPTYDGAGDSGSPTATITKKKKNFAGKLRFLSGIFRSGSSNKPESEPRISTDTRAGPSSSSPSWFSTVVSGRRKKPPSWMDSLEDFSYRDRGMSPEMRDYEDLEASPWASGYSTEAWRTPVTAPPSAARQAYVQRNVAGMTFCLSPLFRASPGRRRSQKAVPSEGGYSGEIRVSSKPHLSTASSFCANRSRKLTDFGRFNHNH